MKTKLCADCGKECNHDWAYKIKDTIWDFICLECKKDKPDIEIIHPREN